MNQREELDASTLDRKVWDLCDGYLALDSAFRALDESPEGDWQLSDEWITLPGKIEYRRSYFQARAKDPDVVREIRRAYLSGAILTVGELLAGAGYLDRSPEFEFVRHVRNAVAHGNVFKLEPRAVNELAKHPACLVGRDGTRTHRVKAELNGRECLFSFLGPNHALEAIQAAAARLESIELDHLTR